MLQCTRKGALDPFFTQLFESPRVVAAVGAGCSIASEALAEVAHYYNFSVVRKINPSVLIFLMLYKGQSTKVKVQMCTVNVDWFCVTPGPAF